MLPKGLLFAVVVIFTAEVEQISGAQSRTSSGPQGPDVQYATIKPMNASNDKHFRKRPPQLMYQVTLDNETFTITLRQNQHMTTPGCLIQRHQLHDKTEIYPCAREDLDCFYVGSSDAHTESWVAANVCGGLRGVISIENNSVFVEPLETSHPYFSDSHVHAVYRYHGEKQKCALQDDDFRNNLHVVYGKRKRYVREANTRYIEARLVVDPLMYHFHKTHKDVIQYSMLVFNIASKLYRDSSIQADIYLSLHELYIFEAFDNFTAELTENANDTLKKFCAWQKRHVTQADCSVLLTRLDLESDDGQKVITGLSQPHGMCRADHQCAIVEDDGPAMGITLAHEIGHLLGMTHGNASEESGIMSPGGWSGTEGFRWSPVSARELSSSLLNYDMSCLEKPPKGMASWNRQKFLPGTIYSADQQCVMMYDSTVPYYRYPPNYLEGFDPCRNLLCFVDGVARNVSVPLIDGTDCNNTRTWCIGGKCIPIDQHVRPVDGVWSAWTESYSPCTRSCGGGIEVKRRRCNNPPPQYGGKLCPGFSTKVKICNMQACASDFRDLQCRKTFSSWFSARPNLDLFISDSFDAESCKLRCTNEVVTKESGVYSDGTECLTDEEVPFSRCVDGQCRKIGCDGISESGLEFDVCGVCNGTGNSCEKVFGTFRSSTLPRRNTFVTKIPKGSSNVNIVQLCQGCFISILVDGYRILNSDTLASSSAVYNLRGVQIRYIARPEEVVIFGKLQKDITVEVFTRAAVWTPYIQYTYYRPLPQQILYAWAEIPKPDCSRLCGNGTRTHDTRCMSIGGKFVDDAFCNILTKPNIKTTPCNWQPCPPRWDVGEWTECSELCGIGNMTRRVACVTSKGGVEKEVSATHCDRHNMPVQIGRCSVKWCPVGLWKTETWSQCSASCGEGYRTRRVDCVASTNDSYHLDSKYCAAEDKPAEAERCFVDYCYVNESCRDTHSSCPVYCKSDVTSCDNQYKSWTWKNCAATCKYCLKGYSKDQSQCSRVDQSVNACTNPLYSYWMRQNCPQTCRLCQDYTDCEKFDVKYCRDPRYIRYMNQNCAKTCSWCP